MDGLNGCWSGIEKKLYREAQPDGASLALDDLSSVYFAGDRPEGSAQCGYSLDHRQDRRQLLLAVATDARGIPIRVAVFVFDGGMKSRRSLEMLTGMDLEHVIRSAGTKLQEIVRRLTEDRQLRLTDRTRMMERLERQGVRYVIAGGEWRVGRDRERRRRSRPLFRNSRATGKSVRSIIGGGPESATT